MNEIDDLENDLINVLVKHSVIPEHATRYFKITKRYKYLREKIGMKGSEARQLLAEENNLGLKTIEYILYGKKKQ